MNNGVGEKLAEYVANGITIVGIIIICLTVDVIVRKIMLKYLQQYAKKTKGKWDDIIVDKNILDKLARIVPLGMIYAFAPIFPSFEIWLQRISFSCIVLIVLIALHRVLDAINDIYSNYEISKIRPIKGYLQVIEIILCIIGTIVIISVLIDRSPWLLISGIGAATAVLMLIFQNSILGLVASIQISSNNMLQIGDWIEMPKYDADGDVIEISLHSVKVQNFDKTITNIPTHALISESFRNWRGMQEAGGRRIKRAVSIDVTSIKFCDEKMLEKLEEIQYIKDYIQMKKVEINQYNKECNVDKSQIINGKNLTNIGIFRVYIENYLKFHPKISKGMTQLVRQLPPNEKGLPIEIYAFTNEIDWDDYEQIQSDIFDHIFAVVPTFELRVYQDPTGYDFNKLS